MSLLKEGYTNLEFPIEVTSNEEAYNLYLKEFKFQKNLGFLDILILFANVLRDYLENKVDEGKFGSVSFFLYTSPGVKKETEKESPFLSDLIVTCIDIVWLSEGEGFEKFKRELSTDLKKLELLYQEKK